mmetsp:Transcript_7696/g.14120  ORF Transcript_7696/g.14120 Transcript_7696/m.14120 type:complete len:435 (+) Transcript_7696:39-1343(+)
MDMSPPRVAIIGAGAAGLACARECIKRGLSVRVLESHDQFGGTWSLSRSDSALYDGLRTNLPTVLMQFEGVPFRKELTKSFVTPKDMETYLLDFVSKFDLAKYVELETPVERVSKSARSGDNSTCNWLVKTKVSTEEFDAVVVCNGHFNEPLVPEPLLSQSHEWKGKAIHSKSYRRPQEFANKVVVVVGGKSSGTDIAKELDGIAKEVHVCDEGCPEEPYHKESTLEQVADFDYMVPGTKCVHWRPRLAKLCPGSRVVEFAKGTPSLEADVVIFCTGYQFAFEFLDDGLIEICENGKRLRPLHRELMHAEFPSLFFMGVNQPIVPFPFFEIQAKWVAHQITSEPPCLQERMKDALSMDSFLASGVVTPSKAHVLPDQFQYLYNLATEANVDDLPALKTRLEKAKAIYQKVGMSRPTIPGAPDDYRDVIYETSEG